MAWIETVDRIMRLARPVYSGQGANKHDVQTGTRGNPKSKKLVSTTPTGADVAKTMDSVSKLLDGFRKDLEQEGTRVFVVDLANDPSYKVVTTLFVDYLRDKSSIELADKEFQMLGKAVRIIPASSNEGIDLLSGTGLGGFNDAVLGQLTSALDQPFQGWNLPNYNEDSCTYSANSSYRYLRVNVYTENCTT